MIAPCYHTNNNVCVSNDISPTVFLFVYNILIEQFNDPSTPDVRVLSNIYSNLFGCKILIIKDNNKNIAIQNHEEAVEICNEARSKAEQVLEETKELNQQGIYPVNSQKVFNELSAFNHDGTHQILEKIGNNVIRQ